MSEQQPVTDEMVERALGVFYDVATVPRTGKMSLKNVELAAMRAALESALEPQGEGRA